MDKKNKKIVQFFKKVSIIVGMVFVCGLPLPGLAISTSPGKVEIPNILRNSTQTRTVIIGRELSDVQNTTTFVVQPRGEFSQYITGPAEFTMIPGEQAVEYTFDISPQDLANDTYETYFDFLPKITNQSEDQTQNKNNNGANVSVTRGVTLIVRFTVTGDEVIDFHVDNLQVKDTEVNEPLFASIDVYNTGNVLWKPDSIELLLTSTTDANDIVTATITQADIQATQPGAQQTVDFSTNTLVVAEKYRARAKIYYHNAVVADIQSNNLVTVYSPGTMKQQGELLSLTTNKTEYNPNEKIKVEGRFKNTGEIVLEGVLITEVYQADEMKELLRSQEFVIDTDEEVVFPQIIQLATPDTYTLSSYVEYGNKTTAARTVSIIVKNNVLAWFSSPVGGGFVLGGIVVILFVGVLLYKRLRGNRKKK